MKKVIDLSLEPIQKIINTIKDSKRGSKFIYFTGEIISGNRSLKIVGNPELALAVQSLHESGYARIHQKRIGGVRGCSKFQFMAFRA